MATSCKLIRKGRIVVHVVMLRWEEGGKGGRRGGGRHPGRNSGTYSALTISPHHLGQLSKWSAGLWIQLREHEPDCEARAPWGASPLPWDRRGLSCPGETNLLFWMQYLDGSFQRLPDRLPSHEVLMTFRNVQSCCFFHPKLRNSEADSRKLRIFALHSSLGKPEWLLISTSSRLASTSIS